MRQAVTSHHEHMFYNCVSQSRSLGPPDLHVLSSKSSIPDSNEQVIMKLLQSLMMSSSFWGGLRTRIKKHCSIRCSCDVDLLCFMLGCPQPISIIEMTRSAAFTITSGVQPLHPSSSSNIRDCEKTAEVNMPKTKQNNSLLEFSIIINYRVADLIFTTWSCNFKFFTFLFPFIIV